MSMMSHAQRACQIWAVLALAATNRQILTYNMVSQLTGMAKTMGDVLEYIQSFCEVRELPPLTTICVNSETGLPGGGNRYATAEDLARRQLKVFNHDWLAEKNPGPAELEAAKKTHPTNAARPPCQPPLL